MTEEIQTTEGMEEVVATPAVETENTEANQEEVATPAVETTEENNEEAAE